MSGSASIGDPPQYQGDAILGSGYAIGTGSAATVTGGTWDRRSKWTMIGFTLEAVCMDVAVDEGIFLAVN